jgi:uncharacterized membrane protein YoaK (UPF0700 family)
MSITTTRPSIRTRILEYLSAPIREDVLLEIEMLVLSFATGIEDAVTFPDYHVFVSNQTGNTVLLAVGTARIGTSVVYLSNTAISLSMFVLGGWVMGQLGNLFGCFRRGWLLISSIIQTLLVFAAAGIHFRKDASHPQGPVALLVISLLAISAGAQVAMVRALQMTEITTANATGAYVDCFIDRDLYSFYNRPRNRRLLFLTTLCAGSFAGAFIYKWRGSAVTLLICAGFKTLAAFGLFFNKEYVEKDDASETTLGGTMSVQTFKCIMV